MGECDDQKCLLPLLSLQMFFFLSFFFINILHFEQQWRDVISIFFVRKITPINDYLTLTYISIMQLDFYISFIIYRWKEIFAHKFSKRNEHNTKLSVYFYRIRWMRSVLYLFVCAKFGCRAFILLFPLLVIKSNIDKQTISRNSYFVSLAIVQIHLCCIWGPGVLTG